MCLSLSAHCRLDLSFGGGEALCITLWHQDSHGFSHLCPLGDEERESGGCEREAEWEGSERGGEKVCGRNMMGFGENALKNRDVGMRETRVFHLSRLFEQPEINWSSFAAAGGLRISSQINSPQRHPNWSLLTWASLSVLEMTRNQVKSGSHWYGFFVKKKKKRSRLDQKKNNLEWWPAHNAKRTEMSLLSNH